MHLPLRLSFAVIVLVSLAHGQTVADKKFWVLTGASALTISADAYSSVTRIGPHSNCKVEAASPELFGTHPRPWREGLVSGGLFLAGTALSYELKKHRAHLWKIPLWSTPQVYNIANHTYGAVNNWANCRNF